MQLIRLRLYTRAQDTKSVGLIAAETAAIQTDGQQRIGRSANKQTRARTHVSLSLTRESKRNVSQHYTNST